MQSEKIDAAAAARLMGIHPETLKRWIRDKANSPSAYKIGRKYFFNKTEVLEWIENQRIGHQKDQNGDS